MAYRDEVYVCGSCGQEVKVKVGGTGTLKCCGQAMDKKEDEEEQ